MRGFNHKYKNKMPYKDYSGLLYAVVFFGMVAIIVGMFCYYWR